MLGQHRGELLGSLLRDPVRDPGEDLEAIRTVDLLLDAACCRLADERIGRAPHVQRRRRDRRAHRRGYAVGAATCFRWIHFELHGILARSQRSA